MIETPLTKFLMSKSVAVIGGSTLTPCASGRWGTKLPIRDYLVDLASHVAGLEYVAPINPWPFECAEFPSEIAVCAVGRGRLAQLALNLAVLKRARGNSTLLLHYPTCIPTAPIWSLIRARAARIVTYISNDYIRDAESVNSPWKRRWYVHAYERAIRESNAVIVRGRMLAKRALQLNPSVHETVPIAQTTLATAQRDRTRTGADGSQFRILFIGRLLRGKGLQTLLDALAGLSPFPGQGIHLDVVGDGPDAEAIHSTVARGGLSGRCQFHGYVSDPSRLAAIWDGADLLVVPSTSPEGVPRVIEEAFAWGVPVLSTTVGGIESEFREGGEVELVQPGSVDAMRIALEVLLRDPERRIQLRLRGRARMDRWHAIGTAGAQHARILRGTEPVR